MPAFSTMMTAALVNNVVLTQFLGLCPVMGVSKKWASALGMSCATMVVLTLSALFSFLLEHYFLIPLELTFLRTLVFIVTIAAIVQSLELVMRAFSPLLYSMLGLYLPLITTNCAVLGVALLNVQHQHRLIDALSYGIGAGLGFSLVLLLFATLRERLSAADVPRYFQGPAIALITAGFMSLSFMGFAGFKYA